MGASNDTTHPNRAAFLPGLSGPALRACRPRHAAQRSGANCPISPRA